MKEKEEARPDVSKFSGWLTPYELDEEHGGYLLFGPMVEATDAEVIEAVREFDINECYENLGGTYKVSRGYAAWVPGESLEDGESLRLEWSDTPKDGLKRAADVRWSVE